jgi:hypothetical protein
VSGGARSRERRELEERSTSDYVTTNVAASHLIAAGATETIADFTALPPAIERRLGFASSSRAE